MSRASNGLKRKIKMYENALNKKWDEMRYEKSKTAEMTITIPNSGRALTIKFSKIDLEYKENLCWAIEKAIKGLITPGRK